MKGKLKIKKAVAAAPRSGVTDLDKMTLTDLAAECGVLGLNGKGGLEELRLRVATHYQDVRSIEAAMDGISDSPCFGKYPDTENAACKLCFDLKLCQERFNGSLPKGEKVVQVESFTDDMRIVVRDVANPFGQKKAKKGMNTEFEVTALVQSKVPLTFGELKTQLAEVYEDLDNEWLCNAVNVLLENGVIEVYGAAQ